MGHSADRQAGRALLVARARVARGTLVQVQRRRLGDTAPTPGEIEKARAALARFATSSGELAPADRTAHRVAQAWLDSVRSSLWFDIAECADAETLAYRYLCALPSGRCPRGAAWRARRRHRAGLRRWYRCNGTQISILSAQVRSGPGDAPREGPDTDR